MSLLPPFEAIYIGDVSLSLYPPLPFLSSDCLSACLSAGPFDFDDGDSPRFMHLVALEGAGYGQR